MTDRFTLKYSARRRMSAARPSPYGVTLAFLIICTVGRIIVERLLNCFSEWYEYFLYNLYGNAVSGTPELFDLFQQLWAQSGLIIDKPVLDNSVWIYVVLAAAFSLLIKCVRVGYDSYALKVSRGIQSGARELTAGFHFVTKTVVIIVAEGIVVAVLGCLLILPGIIAAYAYRMSYFIMLDHPDWGPLRCMRESRRMMRHRKGYLFLLDLSFLPWYLLCWLTMGVLYIWKQPMFSVTYALFYGEVSGQSAWDFADEPPQEEAE